MGKESLFILGSGTCVSGLGWEKEDRWPPAYLLEGIGPDLVLFEASEGVRYRINNVGQEYTRVGAVLISHLHPDHFDLIPFIQSVAIKKFWSKGQFAREEITVYGPEGIEESFWKIWRLLVPEHPDSIYGDALKLNFKEFENDESIDFFGSRLSAFKVFHAFGKVAALAFRLETSNGVFAYSGDAGIGEGLEKVAQHADVFLCDCSADVGDDKSDSSGHLNPYQAGKFATKVDVGKLWLTHYSGKDSPEEILKECQKSGYKGQIHVVKDGENLPLFDVPK